MQFQIPQFIETESKIVGPFTLKQFGFIAGAFLCSFALYFVVTLTAWIVLTIPIAGIGASLAFVKVGGVPLPTVILNAVSFYLKPQLYVWQAERPKAQKAEELQESIEGGDALKRVVSGFSLKKAFRYVQTGSAAQEEQPTTTPQNKPHEQYQIFRGISGERRAARRVDYR